MPRPVKRPPTNQALDAGTIRATTAESAKQITLKAASTAGVRSVLFIVGPDPLPLRALLADSPGSDLPAQARTLIIPPPA